ncbi:hypothetical protein ABZ756_10570 [Mammaliicoccus sciuri]|uniref:Preprotein translocase subunit Tim44 n=2 Tax=Sporosarcina newyorkensis TaxID=759851 RepID=A0A1T4YAY4_9BACL|nr:MULTISPECIES: hypothetical protein [Sporosarcina]EGQ26326.1 hypothetical protein HMPREF9372_1606 [Sporosarcina newyorkensis 2681]MBY0223774.1 hypothetical protein [Sporosarcina aquimarina]SKA98435.1 hypothetical protein SAMN04244570_2075 [Sporosarcina newyorkensis]
MKKLAAFFLAATLILSPIGNIVFQDEITAEARGYKSGKKSFSTPNRVQPNKAEKKQDNTNQSNNKAAASKKPGTGGGLMKGLMLGGLAGLLFGSLFANMGMLGSILGLMINVLAIVFIIFMVRKIFAIFKEKERKRNEEMNQWNNR